ncbi:MAG TPA: membrane protein insertion efficiency factor YidD [Candidatus Binatia bacterium]
MSDLPAKLLRALLRVYQLVVSPLLGPACRYVPSCSEYAREAIERHGAARGSLLALRRLGRCHPLGGSGFDPVPEEPTAHRHGIALASLRRLRSRA